MRGPYLGPMVWMIDLPLRNSHIMDIQGFQIRGSYSGPRVWIFDITRPPGVRSLGEAGASLRPYGKASGDRAQQFAGGLPRDLTCSFTEPTQGAWAP